MEELTKFGKGKDSDDDQSELQVVDNTLDWLNKTYEEGLSNYTNFGNDLNGNYSMCFYANIFQC